MFVFGRDADGGIACVVVDVERRCLAVRDINLGRVTGDNVRMAKRAEQAA